MNVSAYPDKVDVDGHILPRALVYGDSAYYFDVDELDDARTTCALIGIGEEQRKVTGLEANRLLRSAIAEYASERDRAWMAPWFRGCVACEIEELREEGKKVPEPQEVTGVEDEAR